MTRRCKPGDLAIIIRTFPGKEQHLGKIVRVLDWVDEVYGWRLDLRPPRGGWYCSLDSGLRPIRPDAGDDETLRWAGKPKGKYAANNSWFALDALIDLIDPAFSRARTRV